ncbi:MAG: FGGY-family carbohydrate kinase, partial [Chitinophagaceae bacterium]
LLQILQALEESGTPIHTIYASGGFIQSNFWLQMVADILNKKLIVSHAADASAMGAVFLSLRALGFITEWEEVKAMVVTSSVFEPEAQAHSEYLVNFKIFETLYSKLRDDFTLLSLNEQKVL